MRAARARGLSLRGVAAGAAASLLLAALAGTAAASPARPLQGAPPKIGHIRRLFNDGCGCTLQLPRHRRSRIDDRFVFMSDLGDRAQMNIDGRDVMLRLVRRNEPGGSPKVGQRLVEEFEGGGAKVKVNYTVTKVCGPGEEGCEVTSYAASIAVTKGGRTRVVRAAGLCGC